MIETKELTTFKEIAKATRPGPTTTISPTVEKETLTAFGFAGWQEEIFDRIKKDKEHLDVNYVLESLELLTNGFWGTDEKNRLVIYEKSESKARALFKLAIVLAARGLVVAKPLTGMQSVPYSIDKLGKAFADFGATASLAGKAGETFSRVIKEAHEKLEEEHKKSLMSPPSHEMCRNNIVEISDNVLARAPKNILEEVKKLFDKEIVEIDRDIIKGTTLIKTTNPKQVKQINDLLGVTIEKKEATKKKTTKKKIVKAS